ncbi:9592_t:CDS:10 [Paraglomus occultum]|uniref:9592_t:CDS:1 n=1 Tax=Paraglomus occultum TaxID=144539 RepID=A0A9N9G169_9GLOM|nr:9592_t:CDS:10 [Paraglomus occultum]
MGKDRTAKRNKGRHEPLYVQMEEDGRLSKKSPRAKFQAKKQIKSGDDEYIDPRLSRKILQIARVQQEELETEDGSDNLLAERFVSADVKHEDSEEDFSEDEDFDYEDLEVEEEDQEILNKFLPSAPTERRTLADIIMEKIEAYDREKQQLSTGETITPPGLSPKIIEVYSKVGTLLKRYKSGKLPKAFKIIPSLSNWEEILYLTRPQEWTPHATYAATRIFVSNLKPKPCQRFLDLVLLDKVRDDIQDNKKLNYHLYMALKKSLYKPAAFFKGILFPLCKSGTCTLREAAIIGSVISKVSIPVLHSSAALLNLAEMDYTGPNSLFIRILLDKKYALPYKVVDALVYHFMRFKNDERTMPVLWHQSFLVFAQRYKQDLTPDQKDALLEVLKYKCHDQITPEIRREIVNSVARGEIIPEAKRTKKVGVVGKYGTRYGASLRKQIKKMEITQHQKYTCTFCGKDTVKRKAVGIWECKACRKVLAGGAWTVSTTAAATVRSTIRRLRELAES